MASLEDISVDIASLARQSGATAEDGSRAVKIFCFTESELVEFGKKIAGECNAIIEKEADRLIKNHTYMGDDPPASSLTRAVAREFGIHKHSN